MYSRFAPEDLVSRRLPSLLASFAPFSRLVARLTQICTALGVIPVRSANLVRSSLLGNVLTTYASSKIFNSSALVRLRFFCSVEGVDAGRLVGDGMLDDGQPRREEEEEDTNTI